VSKTLHSNAAATGSESGEAQVTIRPASIDDLREIAIIWSEGQMTQGDTPPNLDEAMEAFRTRVQERAIDYGIWVAEVEGVVVGWQSLYRFRANPIHNWAESSTYISQRHKGCGIGRKLLTFATQHANVVKLTYVAGFIKASNEAPIKIVESLGWHRVGLLPRSKSDDIEWLYYVYAVPHE